MAKIRTVVPVVEAKAFRSLNPASDIGGWGIGGLWHPLRPWGGGWRKVEGIVRDRAVINSRVPFLVCLPSLTALCLSPFNLIPGQL